MGAGKAVGGIILAIIIIFVVIFALEYFQIFSVPVLGPAIRNIVPL